MLVVDEVELGLLVEGRLLHGVVNPNPNLRITASGNQLEARVRFAVVALHVFAEIKCPDFLVVHLESILAHLFLDVPNLDHSVHAGSGNLKAQIKPV